MSFRDSFRRVFHRRSNSSNPKSNSKGKGNGIKIEYYRRGEVPRSKFRGPFNPEHQKMLAAWSFENAMGPPRTCSMDLSLSPCATLGENVCPLDTRMMMADEEVDPLADAAPDATARLFLDAVVQPSDASITVSHDEYAPDRQADSGSQSSATAVDPDSFNGSMATLLPEPLDARRRDSIALIKETIRYTSPLPAMSPKAVTPHMPFSPDELARALHAVQLYA
ncbi:hypothetical protein ASPZODRAFT_91326 [Penicilliopsis zonata CBS 506.65]|uniref:Uncharacterized protein n=1 Tax=Penicilliopsis zonata CBS 506.65 TaxID=1073090 RepID=A0A1L9SPF7_9EURO|nr:hypothetical protein ASPZODRAFT_91326 [Penicilliopsis zonata CBS 506.65]OJJ49080.1 hypothetical protein ASPZODRAFT_91326 [Penicilliopsis zonata CBS 506.65]